MISARSASPRAGYINQRGFRNTSDSRLRVPFPRPEPGTFCMPSNVCRSCVHPPIATPRNAVFVIADCAGIFRTIRHDPLRTVGRKAANVGSIDTGVVLGAECGPSNFGIEERLQLASQGKDFTPDVGRWFWFALCECHGLETAVRERAALWPITERPRFNALVLRQGTAAAFAPGDSSMRSRWLLHDSRALGFPRTFQEVGII